MILPNKYISINNSFIGESAKVLSVIGKKKLSIDKIWSKIQTSVYCKSMSFEKFIQVMTFMYACGLIQFNVEKGILYNENLQS